MGFPADADDGRPARRTVVAQDLEGRILLIIAPRGYLSLHELAFFLSESDLDLDVALNLDGGFSTGLWLRADAQSVGPIEADVDRASVDVDHASADNATPVAHRASADSLVPVPSVISVYHRRP